MFYSENCVFTLWRLNTKTVGTLRPTEAVSTTYKHPLSGEDQYPTQDKLYVPFTTLHSITWLQDVHNGDSSETTNYNTLKLHSPVALNQSRQPLTINHITYDTSISVQDVRSMIHQKVRIAEGLGCVVDASNILTIPVEVRHRPIAARLRFRPHALQYVSLSTRRHIGVLLTPHTKHTCGSQAGL